MSITSLAALTALALIALAASSCTAEEAKEAAKAAATKGAELAREGAQLAKEGYEAAKPALEQGAELVKEGVIKGAELVRVGYEAAKPTLHNGYDAAATHTKNIGGKITDASWSWLQAQAAKSDRVTALIDRTQQVTTAAAEIYAALDAVIDTNADVEVIYQPLSDRDTADRAIQAMPRVEVIDGLQVGFQDMTGYQNAERVSESAYMVVWRQNGHLVGFIYRSRTGVKLDVLVQQAPRLIAAVRSVGRAVVPSLKSANPLDPDATDAPDADPTPPTPQP